MKSKVMYVGAGAGLVAFAIYGLLPGSFLGGIMGLNIAGFFFGQPVESEILPRLIVAVSMMAGVMVAGLMFLAGGLTAGWLIGSITDTFFRIQKKAAHKERPGDL
ncbi:MAG: hypothetical protein JSV21_03775 [Nitrospirota bacterium]|nr:MAG: hypothetical protein JSV21_03775 [Nitrospirota bacterium]